MWEANHFVPLMGNEPHMEEDVMDCGAQMEEDVMDGGAQMEDDMDIGESA